VIKVDRRKPPDHLRGSLEAAASDSRSELLPVIGLAGLEWHEQGRSHQPVRPASAWVAHQLIIRRVDIMNHSADGAQPLPTQDRSAGDLVKQLSEQISVLVRDEMKLAQLEMTRKGKQAGMGVGMLGGSGLIALYGIGCLIACVVIAISGAIAAWLAALIVGIALLAVAAATALMGKGRLQRATPPVPEEAVSSVKADVTAIKEGARQ
jgi:uncharacterized membrane protein YqjE